MPRGGRREGAGRKPGPQPVSAGRISLEHRRMLERMAAHRGQRVRQVLEAAIEHYHRLMSGARGIAPADGRSECPSEGKPDT